MKPSLKEEKSLWKKGYKFVAGLDEAGRGALAGPVVAAAVMVNSNSNLKFLFSTIKDSKKLSPKQREKFYAMISNSPCIQWAIGKVSEKMIDKINIKNASELAMEKALENLEKKIKKRIDFLIIDGNQIKSKKLKAKKHKLIIKADEKILSCTLASIIAKVTRDKIMERYHLQYPKYQFQKHKGYPTLLHRQLIRKYGFCKIHRKTFSLI